MRRHILVIAWLALSACAQKTLDFVFLDMAENRQYHSTSLREDFELYSPGFTINPFLILIEGPNTDDAQLQEQLAVLERAEHGTAEKLGLVYVVSSFSGGYAQGYQVSTPEAQRLAGKLKGFRVRVLSPKGLVLKQSDRLLSVETIKKLINNHAPRIPNNE